MITIMRSYISRSSNGRVTNHHWLVKTRRIRAITASNHWSSTENSATNSWNVNFSNGNFNNNNKYNSNVVRAVAALDEQEIISIIEAYEDCCRNKKTSLQCTYYRFQYEYKLLELYLAMRDGYYEPSTSTVFIVTRPKVREIFAADFVDRIAQHWITLRIEPLLEVRFISQGDVSYNCRKGYGTLRAVQKLQSDMLWAKANISDPWIGKFDIKAFFMSIDTDVLFRLYRQFIIDNYRGNDIDLLLRISEITIRHRPQTNCKYRGRPSLKTLLPNDKSLFYADSGIGMPIGNITSQLLANFYNSFLDGYVLDSLAGNGRYGRFVDDFYIISDRDTILRLHATIDEWLRSNLHLTLHPKKVYIQPLSHGVKYVGSIVKYQRRYLIGRTIGSLHNAMKRLSIHCQHGLTRQMGESDMASINSLLGFARHHDTFSRKMKVLRKTIHRSVFRYFVFERHYNKILIRHDLLKKWR